MFLLDTIDPDYFSEEFDPSLFELNKLADRFDQASIDRDRNGQNMINSAPVLSGYKFP